MQYLKYLRYLVKHKWYVTIECFKHGLIWRGLLHDLSKFFPSEFIPYANFFYADNGKAKPIRDKTGYYKSNDTGDPKFDFAWFQHQKRNKHHWQYWVYPIDYVGVKILPIPEPYFTEMVCDWFGASKAQGFDGSIENIKNWYDKNATKMQIAESTRIKIEEWLNK